MLLKLRHYGGSHCKSMSMKLPRLPLGISDFAKLRQAKEVCLYIDKTKDLFEMLQTGSLVEFKLGTAKSALKQIKKRRYYEAYLSDKRAVVLLGAGGFAERAIQCEWEEVKK